MGSASGSVSASVSYMGTKRALADDVRNIVRSLPDGPVLDAFSGMCAVGTSLAPDRHVWVNDVQPFAALVSKTLCATPAPPPTVENTRATLASLIDKNARALRSRFSSELRAEGRYLKSGKFSDAMRGNEELPYVGSSSSLERERRRLTRRSTTFPFRLATITFAGSFFGAAQCIDIDSIRFAISAARDRKSLTASDERWLLVALGSVMSRVNSSTGQFAQYLRISASNLDRVIQKRRRCVRSEFFEQVSNLAEVGTRQWRRGNRAFQQDTSVLLRRLKKDAQVPAVVYADPPYSKAQYSRYYHVLDTIVRYDYPEAIGIGRYPNESARFRTLFALAGHVEGAMRQLVSQVANMGSDLVLSYPQNGLFSATGGDVEALLGEHFRHVRIHLASATYHSTFGGSYAASTVPVEERLYVAQI